MSSTDQPKAKKQRTSNIQHNMVASASASTLTSTQPTEIATATAPTTTILDTLPDEILLHIAMYTGAHSCYLGYGVVNKRINQLFNTYNDKLSKLTSYGGYVTFQKIVKNCEKELKREKEYKGWNFPDIFHQLASGAVSFNREDLFNWALEEQNKYIFQTICERALKDGKLLIFKKVWKSIRYENAITYLREETSFIRIVAEKGFLNWLIYLREELECEWDKWACYKGAKYGHLDCLVYLHEQGCEWDSRACEGAAGGGHIDCLVYLHKQGCPWDESACSWAAEGGHIDCLVYLHKQGCAWDEWACKYAAKNGHLDCLVYLHEQGCGWDESACSGAANNGHLDCLIYLHKQGCPWDEWACKYAALGGHLNCLKYLHEQGCPWNNEACYGAVNNDHLACLQYMRDNGLEWYGYDKYLGSISQGSGVRWYGHYRATQPNNKNDDQQPIKKRRKLFSKSNERTELSGSAQQALQRLKEKEDEEKRKKAAIKESTTTTISVLANASKFNFGNIDSISSATMNSKNLARDNASLEGVIQCPDQQEDQKEVKKKVVQIRLDL